jgi:ATP-binding cassette, subfamily D (ALD), peroxisomal long-chain fatty acid import protein
MKVSQPITLTPQSVKGLVDAQFFERIKELLRIAVPGWGSKESKYIFFLSILLVLRTQLSIWLADVNGKVVKAIVERDFGKFSYRVSIMSA